MKILLEKNQSDLLKQAGIAYSADDDYSIDDMVALEDAITDYVVYNEIDSSDNTTNFGDALLGVHDYIVEKYDS
jgi:hypothetical protein